MSGHSKWSTIKNAKGAADAKRGNLFTKLSRNIIIAARDGGADLESNFILRLVVNKAREANMPKDNIERAIKKGTGELEGEVLEEIMYEAYGPNGVALLIETVTDNKNRTVQNIKTILGRNNGNLGAVNSVKWMFERKGVILISLENLEIKDKEEIELFLIDCGAEDINFIEENEVVVQTKLEDFQTVIGCLNNKGIKEMNSKVEYVAKDFIEIDSEGEEKILKLIDRLQEDDDVSEIYTNI